MDFFRWIFLMGAVIGVGHAATIIGDFVNRVLAPQPDSKGISSSLRAGSRNDILSSDDPSKTLVGEKDMTLAAPPPVLPALKLPVPRARPSPREMNRNLGKALSFVSILGQIDSYIAERARALIRKLLLVVDDDPTNRIQHY